ncbi:hypothetical protein CR513_18999, partial [Mucuna pruriens]
MSSFIETQKRKSIWRFYQDLNLTLARIKFTKVMISQRKYVFDLFKEIGKLGCKTTRVPIEQNHKIESKESPLVEKSQYLRLVGKLIYLSHTRPNKYFL